MTAPSPRCSSGTAGPSDGGPIQNTDRHLWPQTSEDAYAPSLFVTANGEGIGINVGGSVYVKTLREWHRLAGGPIGILDHAQAAPRSLDALAKKISAKIAQLEHYKANECQLDHARIIAEGRLSQAHQIQLWIAELDREASSVSSTDRKCTCGYLHGHADDCPAISSTEEKSRG